MNILIFRTFRNRGNNIQNRHIAGGSAGGLSHLRKSLKLANPH